MQTQQTFSSTAGRGSYLSRASALLGVALLEAALLGMLIMFLVPHAGWRVALLALLGALVLGSAVLLLAPLWTCHRLTDTHLQLRFGVQLRTDIPRSAVASAAPLDGGALVYTSGAQYDAAKRQVCAVMGSAGQVRIMFAAPQRITLWPFDGGIADTLIISVDQRETLLAALQAVPSDNEHAAHKATCLLDYHFNAPLAGPDTTAPVSPAISIQHLTRRYGSTTVVANLQLAVAPGEVYGFLGANGAGKTTTITMLVGLLRPTAGSVAIAGCDVWADPLSARAAFGYVPDHALLYDRLTGREFLHLLAQIRGLELSHATQRISELFDLLELSGHAEKLCESYSLGMKRKLMLSGALLHQPPVLILDEPLNGLDPHSARRLKDLLRTLAAGGTTVFLSIHDLATAEELCDRVGIIHRGTLIAEGHIAELQHHTQATSLETAFLRLTAPGVRG